MECRDVDDNLLPAGKNLSAFSAPPLSRAPPAGVSRQPRPAPPLPAAAATAGPQAQEQGQALKLGIGLLQAGPHLPEKLLDPTYIEGVGASSRPTMSAFSLSSQTRVPEPSSQRKTDPSARC